MKEIIVRLLLFVSLLFCFSESNATHNAGGYLTYKCNGAISATEAEYAITMFFYRDTTGNPGTQPDSIPITVFQGGNLANQFAMKNLTGPRLLPDDSNPCVTNKQPFGVEEYRFDTIITLSRSSAHTLAYQRCCKRPNIANLTSSENLGNTFVIDIPAFDMIGCNSAPVFNKSLPAFVCNGFDLNLDLSVLDTNDISGDSIAYSFCAPFDYNIGQWIGIPPTPAPDTASFPPYTAIQFQTPQTATNPIPSDPSGPPISINSTTGLITGSPLNIGIYVIGVCIEEWRNDVLINIFRREILLRTAACDLSTTSAALDQQQMQFCNGFEVQFTNQTTFFDSVAGTSVPRVGNYLWDFGVDTLSSDTSTLENPRYTFPGPGKYPITLTVFPDFPACSGTSIDTFDVRPVLDPLITTEGKRCVDNSSVEYIAIGTYEDYATFEWEFTNATNISTSIEDTVLGVNYPGQGAYPVQLVVSQDGCTDTVRTITTLFDNPTASFTQSDSAGCFPLPINFTSNVMNVADLSTIEYEWEFGDDSTSTLANPSHTYLANGIYDVKLTIRTTSNCIDTFEIEKTSAVVVSLALSTNMVDFTFDPSTGCAPFDVQFTNQSIFEGNANFTWNFGDGTFSSEQSPRHEYQKNGLYSVSLTMETLDKCVETIAAPPKVDIIDASLVYSTNVVDFDFFPKEGCPPLTVQFSDSSFFEGNAKYFWDFGDGTLDTVQNPIKTFSDSGRYTVGLLLIPSDKCVDTIVKSLPDSLRVLPEPIAQINASDSALPLKQALIRFDNKGSEGVQDSRYFVNGLEISTDDFVDYQFTDTGHFTVSYIAMNASGCEDTSSAEVFVFDEFQFVIPNVFTPNQDGINDEFAVTSCGVYEYEIEIYNRFGESVFKSNSLNINWDGRISGRSANSGVYFYTIRIQDFRGEYLNYNGSVTLMRD